MLKIYNTLSEKVEEFKPLDPKAVTMYNCGPTVYNYVHIGNLRAYIFNDLLKRYLKFSGYNVRQVMNITDIDDKTIKASQAAGKSLKAYTEFYTQEFLTDLKALNISLPDFMPCATEHISEMLNLIRALKAKGFTYESNGSTYFKISAFKAYGRLAHLDQQALRQNAQARLNTADEYDKENVQDFVLWKAWDEADGPVFWETEFGKGRPGWHLECSAMSMKYLGETLDLHTGGLDLIFPHHTNEIAQSEAATGKPFVHYWLHNGYLMVGGKKMSKSLHNFYTLRDLQEQGFHPLLLKILLLKTHYRLPFNFVINAKQEARAIADKFIYCLAELEAVKYTAPNDLCIEEIINNNEKSFNSALDEDLNISLGLAQVFEFINQINKQISKLNLIQAGKIKAYLFKLDQVLGFIEPLFSLYQSKLAQVNADPEVASMLKQRQEFKAVKDYASADKLRQSLAKKGIIVKDTSNGAVRLILEQYI